MPFLIVFDGPDYCGKTTQIGLVAETFTKAGIPFIRTREPGGCPEAEVMRSKLLSDAGQLLSAAEQYKLVTDGRELHVMQRILPALHEGNHVLCDRFDFSTWAYQCRAAVHVSDADYAIEDDFRIFRKMFIEKHLGQYLRYLVFDVEPEVAEERMKADTGSKTNHLDTATRYYRGEVRAGFLDIAHHYHTPVIDANRSIAEVHQDVMDQLKKWEVFP